MSLIAARTTRLVSALDLAKCVGVATKRHSSSFGKYRKPGSRIGQTSVFVQTGLKIRELPLVVKKVNDVLNISGMDKFKDVIDVSNSSPSSHFSGPVVLDDESKEIVAGFNRVITVSGIFRLLETIPAEEVTPPVAIHALKRIIDLENNLNLRNSSYRETLAGVRREPEVPASNETFLRIAFINMLLDIVYRCRDPRIILEGFQIVSRDTFPGDQTAYKERIAEETLVCIAEGIFNLKQVCEAVVILSDFHSDKKKSHDLADKLWSGILDRADEINAETISSVFVTLPHLKQSRDIVLKLVESRVSDFWQEYRIGNIIEILKVLKDLNLCSDKVLKVISQWITVNVHTLKETELLAIIFCFHKLEYIDKPIIRTMEKYMKVRGVQIKERDLVATICDYCLDFRVRSKLILEGASEYFIEHGRSLSTPQIFSLTR